MTTESAYKAYVEFTSLSLHFTTKFDYHKYKAKPRSLTRESFAKRNDHLIWKKASKTRYFDRRVIAFFTHDWKTQTVSVGQVLSEEGDRRFVNWTKNQQSYRYLLKHRLKCLDNNFDANIKCPDGSKPVLFSKMLAGEIFLDDVIRINRLVNMFPMWDQKMEGNLVWHQARKKLIKYEPFVDHIDIRNVLIEHFNRKNHEA